MHKHETLLLSFLSASVNHDMDRCLALLPVAEDTWKDTIASAGRHGVSGLLYSQFKSLPQPFLPPRNLIMELFAREARQRKRYQWQTMTAQRFASALNEKGVEMKVLKGISFSTYYDDPALRECGDCDVFLTDKEEKECRNGANAFDTGNETIMALGGNGDHDDCKHAHLYLDRFMFENHQFLTNFNNTKNGKHIERLMENALCSEPGSNIVSAFDGQTMTTDLIRPNIHFNALFLIFHAQHHFISEGINLRMIYDWAVMLRAEQDNINWQRLYDDFNECKLGMFADAMTAICVEHLGLAITSSGLSEHLQELSGGQNHTSLAEEILADTLADTIHVTGNETFGHKVLRILSRYQRFWHYRALLSESIPLTVWNTVAFSSYMKRRMKLGE